VLEDRVLGKIFRPKVTEEWRKLHNEFHDLYSSPNMIINPLTLYAEFGEETCGKETTRRRGRKVLQWGFSK
jgi:hypothetical protein